MGKRNRKRNKKNILLKEEGDASLKSLLNLTPPSIEEIQDIKEVFSESLGVAFKESEARFMVCLSSRTNLDISEDFLEVPSKEVPALPRLEAVYYFDLSNETGQIFDAHLNKFLKSLLCAIQPHIDSEQIVPIIEDALGAIDNLASSISDLTACMFQDAPISLSQCILNVFKELCKTEDWLLDKINLICQELPRIAALFEDKRPKEEDKALDLEVLMFQEKLALKTPPTQRLRPKITEEWMSSLISRLTKRFIELTS